MKLKYIITILIILLILSSNVYAVSDIIDDSTSFIGTGKDVFDNGSTMDTDKLMEASSAVYNVFLGIGIAVAIIIGAILGIQFMSAGIDQKVKVKEALLGYVISCLVLFGAFGIWKLVVTIMGEI